MPNGTLRLSIVNVYGEPVQEPVHISLVNQALAEARASIDVKPGKVLNITGLNQTPQGLYRIEIDALSYIPVSQFINIPASKSAVLVATLPVNSNRVVSVNFPSYTAIAKEAQRLLAASEISGRSGTALYESFDDLRKAGFLNLVAKAQHTRLINGETVLSNLDRITEQRGDRLFAIPSPSLHGEVLASITDGAFHLVSDTLHIPAEGFELFDSFKTPDLYGNLQLTFSRQEAAWSVDMDIDDAQGFEHIFQVVHNAVTGQPTHPYNIHEILVEFQELDPGYTFNLASSAASGKTVGAAG